MLLNYENFNKKFGVKKIQSFAAPKVLNLNEVVIPYYSMLYVFNPNSQRYVTNDHYFIKYTKKKFLFNVIEYEEPIYDKYRIKQINESTLVRTLMKEHPGIKILPTNKFERFLSTKPNDIKLTLPIINYNQIHKRYVYKNTFLDYFYMFKNSLTTLVNDIIKFDKLASVKSKHNIEHFVILEIPDLLYSLPIIEKYYKYETANKEMLKLFYDTSRLLMLELFKLLDDDLTENSIFYKLIKTNKAGKVTLVLTIEDKGVVINLRDLYSFLKLSSYENNSKLEDGQLRRLLFFMLKTVINVPGFSPEDIDDNNYGEKILSAISKTDIGTSDGSKELFKEIDLNTKNLEHEDKIIKHIEKKVDDDDDFTSDKELLAKIDEDLKEEEETSIAVDYHNKYNKAKDIEKEVIEDKHITDVVVDNLTELAENKKLPKPKYKKLVNIVNETVEKPSPFNDGKKIKDYLKVDKKELIVDKEKTKLVTPKVIYDKDDANDPIATITKDYVKNVYKKDLVSSVMGIQKAGLIVKDMKREESSSVLGDHETLTISLNDLGKSNYDIKVKLPKINEDGEFKLSGNSYILKKQRSDVPIKKISYNRVSLNSAYGKIFVDRAPLKRMDRGFSIKRQLLKMSDEGIIKNLVSGTIKLADTDLPFTYSMLSRNIKSFIYGKYAFSFSYNTRETLIGNNKLEDIEKGGYVVCGKTPTSILVIGKDESIYEYNKGKYTSLGHIEDFLKLDKSKLKIEFSTVKVKKSNISTALILSYYLGLKNMLKLVKAEYEILDGPRVKVNDPEAYVVRFKFNTLVIKKPKEPKYDLILAGFSNEQDVLKKIDISLLENKDLFKSIFNNLKLNLLTITEIELLETLFVDPVTKSILESMNEPTTFIGLLIRSNELLVNDYYMHPNSLKGFVLKGYERVPQYVYKTMVDAIKKKKNEEFFGRSRLVVDPYSTWKAINEDGASTLAEDLNPIAMLKLSEDTTFLGGGGRSKESLAEGSREYHKDDVGVISESSKDSSDVGITAFMSANPVLNNVRGLKDNSVKKLKPSNILSTSAMLAPFSMQDDPKRLKRLIN